MESTLPLNTVLLVDDVDTCRLTTKWFLESIGYAVHTARSSEEALSRFDPQIHRLVITDNSMPGMSGASMAVSIKRQSPATPIIMYSSRPPDDHGLLDLVVRKPAHLLILKEGIDRLMNPNRMTQGGTLPRHVPIPPEEPQSTES